MARTSQMEKGNVERVIDFKIIQIYKKYTSFIVHVYSS